MTEYVPHKIRSHPFRFISLPILITLSFILYWLMLTPLLYVFVLHKLDSHKMFNYVYWSILLLVYLILLTVLIMIWRCKRLKSNETIATRQSEYNTLLKESHCAFNKDANVCTLENFVEYRTEKKCDLEEEDFCARETLQEEIDQALNERVVVKRRPKTLHIDTARVETVKSKDKRLSSPLTPREIFFFDLIQNANKQRNSVTDHFLENERKMHSDGGNKVESNRMSNSEFFIMNVGDKLSCTAEAFIYVDEEKSEPVLQVRKESDNDDVFLAN